MTIDNLNVMTSWLPAGQQTDQYSTKPWCLRSKNLDIFSSSKSAKGTAWSEATQDWDDIVKQVEDLVLKTNSKVYKDGVEFVNPVTNFPSIEVAYGWVYAWHAPAQRWTPKDMTAQYEWWTLKTFNVFTDRIQYNYNSEWIITPKDFAYSECTNSTPLHQWERWSMSGGLEWYMFQKLNASDSYCRVCFYVDPKQFINIPLVLSAYPRETESSYRADVYLDYIEQWMEYYYYDPQTWWFVPRRYNNVHTPYWEEYMLLRNPIYLNFNIWPESSTVTQYWVIQINYRFKKHEWSNDYQWNWALMVDFLWWPDKDRQVESLARENGTTLYYDSNYSYNLLPIKRQRKLKKIWEYYWEKWDNTQVFYQYAEYWRKNNNWLNTTYYDLEQYMAWDNPATMDVIDMISWNEKIYMIGNMDWNGYIIPCELTGWKGTPYIAYGCTFKGATNIDYLMYLVGEDRGISQLWCYNTQELVPLIWGDKKKVEVDSVTHEKADNDFIDTNEQYRFNWKMVEYRGDLVLATEDNRLFRYGQTAGGKGGSFIFDIPWEITDLRTENDNLIVSYEVTRTETDENEQEVEVTYKYNRTYQDDIADKNYLTEREAVYPIVLWNHLLEKEESDLYTSYILPSKDCKLEFWGAGNHYHYRTFKVWNVVPWSWISPSVALELLRTWKLQIAGTTWAYRLEYVEDDGTRFTYRLVGDLPQQTENSIKQLTKATTNHNDDPFYTFTEFHHFRKIGEITAEGYTEGEYRFHNLNNKLELPKTHSLQIMVKGTWTAEASPELFTVDLIANQRERW